MEEFMILDPQGEYQVCGTYRLVLSPKSALTCVRESCKGKCIYTLATLLLTQLISLLEPSRGYN